MNREKAVRVLLVDDHTIVVDALRHFLEGRNAYKIVGSARDGAAAVQLVSEVKPDVVLVDIDMPKIDGISATRLMVEREPGTKVIALSVHDSWDKISAMFDAGAAGYVPKTAAIAELDLAIQAVQAGHIYISPIVSSGLLKERNPSEADNVLNVLTRREREIFLLLAEGKTSKEISFELALSGNTVQTHRRRILRKLGLEGIADLVKLAVKIGAVKIE